jgi:hypothetical protein
MSGSRVLQVAHGQTSNGTPAGLLVHPGPDGRAVVVLTIKGGPTIAVELDPENGGHLCQQLDTVLRDLVH